MAETQDIDSTCSTPYVSAPSSPGRNPSGYFFSAPASPMHYVLSKTKSQDPKEPFTSSGSFEFEFSSRFSPTNPNSTGSMSSADELFFNGQIRPMRLSSHLQRPQILSPLLDLDTEDEESDEVSVTRGRDFNLRNRSVRRKARSMSPLRNIDFEIEIEIPHHETKNEIDNENENDNNQTPSSSRSSSSGRNNSKKWIFLKDLLYRSKSEGRGNSKEKFWSSISFSPSKDKKSTSSSPSPSPSLTPSSSRDEREKSQSKKPVKKSVSGKPANGVSKRRQGLSAHELHYTTNRAQAEEMKKKTFLPYRQGLLGCLGFNSKSYGALNGLARSLNPVSSR